MVSQLCVAVKAPCRRNPVTVSHVADMSATFAAKLLSRGPSGPDIEKIDSSGVESILISVLLALPLLPTTTTIFHINSIDHGTCSLNQLPYHRG